jgi:tetratricopeptide (TPR) repeat protein
MRRLLLATFLLLALPALPALPAAAAGRPPRAPAASAPAAPRDTTAPRGASEESLRRYLRARLLEQSGKLTEALAEYYRALSHDPDSPDLLVRISQVCAQLGDPARSLEFAERALRHAPDDWRALWLKGAALFSTQRAAEALAPLERACELDSTQADVLRTTARVAEALQRADVAERAWRRLVWVDDEDGEAWFQIARAQASRGDLPGAEHSLERASALNPARPGLVFLRGWIQENLGRPERAIEQYRSHLANHPTDVGTRRRLVGLYTRAERLPEAFEEARRVTQADPNDPEAAQVLADLAFRTGHEAEAAKQLARLRGMNPGEPENTARVIGVLARNARGLEAARWADRWAAEHPDHAAGPALAVRAWTLAGQPDTAVARARRALAAAPDSAEPRRLLARALVEAKRYPEAEREWLALHQRFPKEPGYLLDLGGCRERAGDADGAIEAGRRALAIAPDWAPALNFLGYVLADHGRELEAARRHIERALEASPDNGAYVDSFGWVLYRLGRLDEARAQLERAVLLTGGDPIVHEHLGDVYRDLRLMTEAREQYRRSHAIEGDHQKRVGEKLRDLR